MIEAVNDQAIREIIIDAILNHYPHLIPNVDELADELGPYLVESMWSAFDKDLEQELHSKGD